VILRFHSLDDRLAEKLRRLDNVRIIRIREQATPHSCGAKVQTTRVELSAPVLAEAVVERNTVQDYLAFEGEGLFKMQRIFYIAEYSPELASRMERFLEHEARKAQSDPG
jgi:hypothetical protein